MLKKDCWSWIEKKIEKTGSRLKKPNSIYLTFFFYRDGNTTYTLGTSSAYKDYDTKFQFYDVINCIETAKAAGLHVETNLDLDDNPFMVITFTKNI